MESPKTTNDTDSNSAIKLNLMENKYICINLDHKNLLKDDMSRDSGFNDIVGQNSESNNTQHDYEIDSDSALNSLGQNSPSYSPTSQEDCPSSDIHSPTRSPEQSPSPESSNTIPGLLRRLSVYPESSPTYVGEELNPSAALHLPTRSPHQTSSVETSNTPGRRSKRRASLVENEENMDTHMNRVHFGSPTPAPATLQYTESSPSSTESSPNKVDEDENVEPSNIPGRRSRKRARSVENEENMDTPIKKVRHRPPTPSPATLQYTESPPSSTESSPNKVNEDEDAEEENSEEEDTEEEGDSEDEDNSDSPENDDDPDDPNNSDNTDDGDYGNDNNDSGSDNNSDNTEPFPDGDPENENNEFGQSNSSGSADSFPGGEYENENNDDNYDNIISGSSGSNFDNIVPPGNLFSCLDPPNNTLIAWIQRKITAGYSPREFMKIHAPNVYVYDDVDDHILWDLVSQLSNARRRELAAYYSLKHAVDLIKTSKRIIVLTGAGVSVSCGIPDFRSANGIYSRLEKDYPDIPDPTSIFDIKYFNEDPRPFYKAAREIFPGQFEPSPSHKFIKRLEERNILLRNYSQNIDTLERSVGISRVIECHGSFATATCTNCKLKVSGDSIKDDILNQRIPFCGRCNFGKQAIESDKLKPDENGNFGYLIGQGIFKPDIVFFDEGLPSVFHETISGDALDCDLLIVIGSSLKVRPVAMIPDWVPSNVPQILINREELHNYNFDIGLYGDADIIVNQLCHMLGDEWNDLCWTEPLEFDSDFASKTNTPDQTAPQEPNVINNVYTPNEAIVVVPCDTGSGNSAEATNVSIQMEGHPHNAASHYLKETMVANKLKSGTFGCLKDRYFIFPGAQVCMKDHEGSIASSDSSSQDDDSYSSMSDASIGNAELPMGPGDDKANTDLNEIVPEIPVENADGINSTNHQLSPHNLCSSVAPNNYEHHPHLESQGDEIMYRTNPTTQEIPKEKEARVQILREQMEQSVEILTECRKQKYVDDVKDMKELSKCKRYDDNDQ